MVRALRGVGEAAVGRALRGEAVDAAGAPGDLGSAELLDGRDAGERPEVAVGDPRELLLHALEEVTRNVQAVVRAVLRLRVKAHRGVIAARSHVCRQRDTGRERDMR